MPDGTSDKIAFPATVALQGAASTVGWKRALDLFGACVGLTLLSPVFALVSLAVMIDSPGGPVFRQRRVGLAGRTFDMYKFRTMAADTDTELHRAYVSRLITEGSEQLKNSRGKYKLEGDPRITPVGRFLRRLSLDELPQLVNVLKGEMSLVGPRPPLEYEVELYSRRQRRRLGVAPGMTGLWQVRGRNSTTFDEMIELDLDYIARRSLALDLRILLDTVGVVFLGRGA